MTTEPGSVEATVTSTLEDGVLLVKLNRPGQLNALTPAMTDAWSEALLAAGRNPDVRAIVVTGEGRAFCAGADAEVLRSSAAAGRRVSPSRYRYTLATQIDKPVIAAINGACIGAGFALAMMCDMRFCAASARVGAGFATLGLPAEHGTAWVLERLCGYGRAFELLTSNRLYMGDELLRLGVVNALLPDADVLSHSMSIARNLAMHCAPRSLATIKRQLQVGSTTSLEQADQLSAVLADKAFAGADFADAISARAVKRDACFQPLGEGWWPSE